MKDTPQWVLEVQEELLRRKYQYNVPRAWFMISVVLNVALLIGFVWVGNLYIDLALGV